MLGNGKLDSLDTRLEQFKLHTTSNQDELQAILKEYGQLLDNYKTLKFAFEGKINGENVEDAISTSKLRNPYIMVLVDGNGYIFNDELVRDKEEGGMRAARMLNDAVEKYLRESLPQAKDARIIVRIYADLTNLSKKLAKSNIIGFEKRSLAPFTAGFTRAINLFDFIDALDEEGTKFKIRESFKLAVKDDRCSHVLYAACHDAAYCSELVSYTGHQNKITLVQGAGFDSNFHQYGLNVTQFPTIFRWSELIPVMPTAKMPTANNTGGNSTPVKTNATLKNFLVPDYVAHGSGNWRTDISYGVEDVSIVGSSGSINRDNGWEKKPDKAGKKKTEPCKYFQKGSCRFGDKCNFQHSNDNGASQPQTTDITLDRSNISSQLPTTVIPGFLPLNKDDHRIDTFIREPTQEEWVGYKALFHTHKPCNSHHLQGRCTRFGCPYDHNPLEHGVRHCLQYIVKCSACPKKGACRSIDCIQGHLCPKNNCVGQGKGCRMNTDMHNVDPKLASMVPAEDDEILHDDNMGVQVQEHAMW